MQMQFVKLSYATNASECYVLYGSNIKWFAKKTLRLQDTKTSNGLIWHNPLLCFVTDIAIFTSVSFEKYHF